jgi:CheY-like chemotaxis protein
VTSLSQTRRVLIVEDNVDLGEMIQDLLAVAGHRVDWVTSGLEAVEAVRRASPEVVICDIGLPGMDGYQVARALRAQGCGAYLVALTGYAQASDRKRAEEAGFDLHLAKPVEPTTLTEMLEQRT